MVTELSKLADLIQQDAIPQWLREELEKHKDEILHALQENGSITLKGPQGEEVTIRGKEARGAAA